ncbi:MAG: mannose-1-phosphate guanylyltransferase, partial [Bacteroidota bacterium]
WSAKSIVAAFELLMPELYSLFSEGMSAFNTSEEKPFIAKNYERAENISIDYGILEKANNVYVKKATFDWNDLGTWGALYDKLNKDGQDNALVRARAHGSEAEGNMIFTSTEKLVVVDGLKDYIIVDKGDVLMIYPKSKEQEIKLLRENVVEAHGKKYS